jgi:hypothetical protein
VRLKAREISDDCISPVSFTSRKITSNTVLKIDPPRETLSVPESDESSSTECKCTTLHVLSLGRRSSNLNPKV